MRSAISASPEAVRNSTRKVSSLFHRYTKPEKDQALLLAQLKLQLPPQPPPEITTDHKLTMR